MMRPYEFENFALAIQQASYQLQYRSNVVHSARWQGADIAAKPEMATYEVAHASFGVPLREAWGKTGAHFLHNLQQDIKPNLPWADDHFLERVGGEPINPGVEWANWPYGKSAAQFLDEDKMFNHNYMERYWPKHAGLVRLNKGATATPSEHHEALDKWLADANTTHEDMAHRGIMYHYGDLRDVVKLLANDPYTRQAYLPVWFPEDTGGGDKRAPCTIGYHFMMRDGKLDVNYHIRSCDFVRHFRDDIYLTARLLLWVMQECAKLDFRWTDVVPGKFFMQIGSLHIFRNDYMNLFGRSIAGQR